MKAAAIRSIDLSIIVLLFYYYRPLHAGMRIAMVRKGAYFGKRMRVRLTREKCIAFKGIFCTTDFLDATGGCATACTPGTISNITSILIVAIEKNFIE